MLKGLMNLIKYRKNECKTALDFIYSDNLTEIEAGITDTINGVLLSRKAICIALAMIKIKELYKQGNINSFKDYLIKQRIPINYSTALDYSIIGEMLIKYENELKKINFTEEKGLQKLLLLEKGLNMYKDQSEVVFNIIGKTSFREFKKFIDKRNNYSNRRMVKKKKQEHNYSIKMDNEKIFFSSNGIEILWFNSNLEHQLDLKIPDFYKTLQKNVEQAVKNSLNSIIFNKNISNNVDSKDNLDNNSL